MSVLNYTTTWPGLHCHPSSNVHLLHAFVCNSILLGLGLKQIIPIQNKLNLNEAIDLQNLKINL